MPISLERKTAALFSLFLLLTVLLPMRLNAQAHIVTPQNLRNDVSKASLAREVNLQKLDRFFSSPAAQRSFKSAHINSQRVKKAVRQLSDAHLADFAARADRAQQQFSAGAPSNQQITYILIGLATAVIILVIVEA